MHVYSTCSQSGQIMGRLMVEGVDVRDVRAGLECFRFPLIYPYVALYRKTAGYDTPPTHFLVVLYALIEGRRKPLLAQKPQIVLILLTRSRSRVRLATWWSIAALFR